MRKSSSVYNGTKKESRAAMLFLLPSFLGIMVFFLLPFLDTVRRSFFNATGSRFVGLTAYISVFSNDAFKLAAINTAKFIVVCIPVLLVVSLLLAIMCRKLGEKSRLFKTSFLLPMAVPVASIVLVWQVLFHEKGLFNSILSQINIPTVDFMNSSAVFWVLIVTYLWKNSGYDMILWLAGLDGITDSQYEAAQSDGANSWQCFWYITVPGIMPTLGLVSILSILNSFKVFREAYLVAGAYPHDSIYMLQHLFNNWYVNLDITRLSAATTIVCAVLLLVVYLLSRFLTEDS